MSADRVLDALLTSCVVVTSMDGDQPRGCLVASVMPVGYRSRTVVFALTTGSGTERAVVRCRVAALNLLLPSDLGIARLFGGGGARFDGVRWSIGAGGAPVLAAAPGVLELEAEPCGSAAGCTLVRGEVRYATAVGPTGPVLTVEDARRGGLEAARCTTGAEA